MVPTSIMSFRRGRKVYDLGVELYPTPRPRRRPFPLTPLFGTSDTLPTLRPRPSRAKAASARLQWARRVAGSRIVARRPKANS